MRRTLWALLAGLLVLLPGAGHAADEGPSGNWKLSLYIESDQGRPPEKQLLWLVQIASDGGKWSAKVLDKIEGAPKAATSDAKVADGTVRFTLTLGETPFQFEGHLSQANGKLITGAVTRRSRMIPAELERTPLKSLDAFDLEKEALPTATGYDVTVKAMGLLSQAEKHKAKPEEVRSWAEKAYKAAEPYGARLQADIGLQIAEVLSDQDGYGDVAVNFARRAERGLEPKAKLSHVKRVLDILAAALKKAGKADEAKEVEARIAKMKPEVKPTPYAGRKAKSDRAVLVELFTGSQCPPCLAADKAFDALDKTYKPGDVVLLEYHEHVAGPDPLANSGSEGRYRYYFAGVRDAGTPAVAFNGKPGAEGGGDDFDAPDKYDEYVDVINRLLEQPAKGALKAEARRTGNKVAITAEASDVDAPADGSVRLRLALVEESVDYKGANGIAQHHHVVRDLPGGALGIPVRDKAAKQSVTVDLDDLRKGLKKYLTEWAAQNEVKFPGKMPEIELKDLRVIAFLQNDKTKEVLQAVQADVKNEK